MYEFKYLKKVRAGSDSCLKNTSKVIRRFFNLMF
jgi:hypothetical protein